MANLSWFPRDFPGFKMESPMCWEPPQFWQNQDAGPPCRQSWSLTGPSGVQALFFLCALDDPVPFSRP